MLCLASSATIALAQGANNTGTYYRAASGKSGAALKTALYGIINSHTDVGYDGLYTVYAKSDVRADGSVRDWYSNITHYNINTDRAGSYKKEGDCFNREHSVPQSWFSKASPMKSDAYHVIPTDGYVNNRRSSYPFGETNGEIYQSANGYSKVGSCTVDGYTGTVFEPNDEIKGDIARNYFYMVTCYENHISSWASNNTASVVFDGKTYPGLQSWTLKMMLRWSKEDPVDSVERARNEAVSSFQKNRNPYIDYPGLEQYVWGDSVNVAFSYDNYQGGGTSSVEPDQSDQPDTPDQPDEPSGTETGLYEEITTTADVVSGRNYLIVYKTDDSSAKALNGVSGKNGIVGTVTFDAQGRIDLSQSGQQAAVIHITAVDGHWALRDSTNHYYLSLTSSDNALNSSTTLDESALWNISVATTATISNVKFTSRILQYNANTPLFRCYTGSQKAVSLYREHLDTTGIRSLLPSADAVDTPTYNLSGQRVNAGYCGIVIRNGRKMIVR